MEVKNGNWRLTESEKKMNQPKNIDINIVIHHKCIKRTSIFKFKTHKRYLAKQSGRPKTEPILVMSIENKVHNSSDFDEIIEEFVLLMNRIKIKQN